MSKFVEYTEERGIRTVIKRFAVGLTLGLLLIFVMTGSSIAASDGTAYELDISGELLLFDSGAESNIIAAGTEALVFTETTSYKFAIPEQAFELRLRGDSLYVLSAVGAECKLTEFSINAGVEMMSYWLEIPNGEIDRADIDLMGRCYIRKAGSPEILMFSEGDSRGSAVCSDGSGFFGVADDTLAVYNTALEFYDISGDAPVFNYRIETEHVPAKVSPKGLYLDSKGILCKYSDSVETVYDTTVMEGNTRKNLISFAENGNVYYVNMNETATCLDPEDTTSPIMYFADNSYAVNGNGILINKNGNYSFMPYSSFTLFEDPEKNGELPEDWKVLGGFIIFDTQKTVASVKAECDCEIFRDDTSVGSGFIRTGMTLNTASGSEYTLVLLGDVNRSGSVNSADRRAVIDYKLNIVDLDEAQLLSADMNGDGNVSVSDAVIISNYW